MLAAAGLVLYNATFRPRLTAAERGRRLAERTGCFGCHGPEGMEGTADRGRSGLPRAGARPARVRGVGEAWKHEALRDESDGDALPAASVAPHAEVRALPGPRRSGRAVGVRAVAPWSSRGRGRCARCRCGE